MNSEEQNKLFLTLLNKVNDAIIATNSYGNILFFNKAAQSMTGFPDKVVRQEWADYMKLMKPDRKTKIEKKNHPIFRALRDERVVNEEMVLAPTNKIRRAVFVNASILGSKTNKEGVILIMQDVTSQKETEEKLNRRSKSLVEAYEGLRRAEAGLKNTNVELEKRVLDRTRHLTRINRQLENEIQIRLKAERQIKKSNSELLKTNRDLDSFIYTASHDLKTPVANIEGLINALKDEEAYTDKNSKVLIDLMKESVEKFTKTIADLNEISKIQKAETGDTQVVDFEEVLLKTRVAINDLISSTNATIYSDFSECSSIHFSAKNLEDIFNNVISNSIKYRSSKRTPLITLRTEKNSKYCILKISDNGMGIEEEKQNQIFSMFKRLHDHVEGSGIGLFIVKRIIEKSEGKIEVSSKVNEGTDLKIYFPLT